MPQNRQLKRQKVSVTKTEDGRFVITPPQHKGLVLSGGGAKGISYGGMIRAMDESGKLKQLTHVSGASAGAMTASLLAIGMSSHDIGKLVSQLDPTKLLDRADYSTRAKGDRFRNMLDIIYMVQIKQHLVSLEKPIARELEKNFYILNTKIALYESILAKQGLRINNVDDIIKLSKSPEDLVKLDAAFKEIPQRIRDQKGKSLESPHFTLGNLGLLRDLLPEKDKHLIKNLSVAVTNQSKHALERYSESTTPQQPIAQIVQWSGAHPVLFVPGVNPKGEYIADGGILDNMPEIDGLDREEVLCAKAETESSFEERVKKADESAPIMVSGFKRALDSIVQSALGGTWLNSTASLLNREKVFYHNDNMLFINTGEVTTTNTSPTEAQKARAIQNGYEQTRALIESQTKTFDHPLMAVLYVGFEQLDKALLKEDTNSELFFAAAWAKKISFLQKQIVEDMNNGDYSLVQSYLDDIEDVLRVNAKMDNFQTEKALALCTKQINFMSEGKLVNYLNEEASKNESWPIKFLNGLVATMSMILSALTFPISIAKYYLSKETMPNPVPETPSERPEDEEIVEPTAHFREALSKGSSHEKQREAELAGHPVLEEDGVSALSRGNAV